MSPDVASSTNLGGWINRAGVWQLGERIPGRTFRYDIMAAEAETLELQHEKLADLPRRPDVLIIYCGHNEFGSRVDWSREVGHYVDQAPPTEMPAA